MEKQDLIEILKFCLNRIFHEDKLLLEIDIHEDAINNRFTRYLSEILESDEINVDAEYNRHMSELKKYGVEGKNAIVDIVVHQRGTDEHNIVAFECKKGPVSAIDLAKIYALIGPEFNYQYGITIEYRSKIIKLYQMVDDEIVDEIIEI